MAEVLEERRIRVGMLTPRSDAEMRQAFQWLLEAAASDGYGTLDVEGYRERIALGEVLLLEVDDGEALRAVAACELLARRDGGQGLLVRYLGGRGLKRWLPALIEGLRELANAHGCAEVVVVGSRPGWSKVLLDFGFRTKAVSLAMPVSREV